MTPATAGALALHRRARPDPYLAMARPSEVWNLCNAVMWGDGTRSDVGSQVKRMLQTDARDLRTSHSDPEKPRSLRISTQRSPPGGHFQSGGYISAPPGMFYHWNASCLDISGAEPVPPKFCSSGAGVVWPLDAHDLSHVQDPARFRC